MKTTNRIIGKIKNLLAANNRILGILWSRGESLPIHGCSDRQTFQQKDHCFPRRQNLSRSPLDILLLSAAVDLRQMFSLNLHFSRLSSPLPGVELRISVDHLPVGLLCWVAGSSYRKSCWLHFASLQRFSLRLHRQLYVLCPEDLYWPPLCHPRPATYYVYHYSKFPLLLNFFRLF